jgi:hypothetical protein
MLRTIGVTGLGGATMSRPPGARARRSGRWCASLFAVALVLSPGAPTLARADAVPAPERPTPAAEHTASIEERLRALEAEVAALRQDLERLGGTGGAVAADAATRAELEKRIEALSEELERLRLGAAASAPEASEGSHGLGPAASKVYKTAHGVSIGGYGEMLYTDPTSRRDDGSPAGENATIDLLRAVLYFGYKFDDHFLFNSEIEYEHAVVASDTEGESEVEFAYVDYHRSDHFGARGGLLLVPLGFLNELHEPPIFFGARRPEVEQILIPTTWRELGAGAYGLAGPVAWKAYLVSSLDATGFTAAEGIALGRQEGSEAVAENFALTARVDWTPAPGWLFGAGAFAGDTAQATAGIDRGRLRLYEAHAEWRSHGWQVRALAVKTRLGDTLQIGAVTGEAVGERMDGTYGEAGWNVLSLRKGSRQELSPFFRYEALDTQAAVASGVTADPANDRRVKTFGIHYRPIPNIALKADWQDFDAAAGTGLDRLNLALGWLF